MKNLKTLLIIIGLNISLSVVALPPDMQADRYLVQVEKALKGGDKDYKKAAKVMDKIMALKDQHNLQMPIEFYFKYAKVLVKGETKPNKAFAAINHYLTATGKSGANYFEALDIYTQAELQVEQNKLQAEYDRKCQLGLIKIGKYIDCNDGIVTDTETGLMWMRCSLGQTWTGGTCTGEASKYKWNTAENLTANFAGFSDWRTPSIKELNTLVYCSNGYVIKYKKDGFKNTGNCSQGGENNYQRPTINQDAFPNTPASDFWSSSPHSSFSSNAWQLEFYNGHNGYLSKTNAFRVRLVRSGQ